MTDLQFAIAPVGMLQVTGSDGVDLLQRLSTNDLRPLHRDPKSQSDTDGPDPSLETVFTNAKGKIIDWVTVTSRPGDLLVQCSHGRAQALKDWIERYTIMEDVVTTDVTDAWALCIIYAPDGEMDEQIWRRAAVAYGNRFELCLPVQEAAEWARTMADGWGEMLESSRLEELRLLAGVPSPQFEFAQEINPLELRLNASVSWSKGCYVGQEVIARLDSYDKVARLLMGFSTQAEQGGRVLEAGGRLLADGKSVGRVTSALTLSDGRTIGLAVVNRAAAHAGCAEWDTSGRRYEVDLIDRPFWGSGPEN